MLPEQKQSFQTFVCVQFMRVHVFTFKCIDLSVCVCSQTSLYIYTSTCFYIQAYVSIIVFYMNFAASYLYNTRKILFIVLKAAYSICIDMFLPKSGVSVSTKSVELGFTDHLRVLRKNLL